jgi:adenylate cyclase class IV
MTPLTYQDFTIKARVENFNQTIAVLQRLGAICLGTDLQTDTYFKTDTGKLKLRVGTIENLITHYERMQELGIEKTVVYRYDVNPTPEEVATLRNNFTAMGEITKERTIYMFGIHKIHLDRINGEHFIEIESIDRDGAYTSEALKALCWEVKDKLLIADEDLVPTGYFKQR